MSFLWARSRRPGRGLWLLRLACCAIVVGWVLWVPAPASAHAVLISSTPAAGSTVGTTPDEVVLRFDEPLVATLSHATVVDPTGARYAGTVSGEAMRIPLTTTVPGVYRVSWATVSQIDGHAITGAFQFGVGVTVASAEMSAGPTRWDLLVAAVRAVEYAVLLLACGLAVLWLLGREIPQRAPVVPVAAVLLASGAVVVFAEAVLATSRVSVAGIADYLSIGVTGWARVTRIGLEAALLVTALARGRLSPTLLTAIVCAIAMAGHAANADPAWLGIAVNAVHLGAAGVWVGGIMALALLRAIGAWSTAGQALLPRFSRVAPWAFLVTVGLGTVQAAQLLGDPSEILGSGYGLTLVVKTAAIAAMVPLSWLAWRRLRPMIRTEAAVALLVVVAAAALAAYPVIPREAREAAEAAEVASAADAQTSPFPRPGDLTIANRAGDTLVGLSLHPARPGRNQVFAYLDPAPPDGTEARLSVAGAPSAMSACGPSCRSATVDLRGGERLTVEVTGTHGGSAVFVLPALPARDGTALAERATAWMDGLDSYHVDEVFAGIHSTYAFARPHMVWMRIWYGTVPRDTVWLGSSVYKRDAPQAPWSPPSAATPAPVPYFGWNPFKPFAAVTVVGADEVDHVPVTLVSLFGGHGDDPEPVWFTLWIDPASGRVLRSQMWAPGHFMDDRYSGFNEPVTIPRPDIG